MKILGIIAEYNPFHNGHLYHLEMSKAQVAADGVICILSSSFLQRGEPGLVDKWQRAKMALKAGIDLVIELPTVYSLRSAEFFAYGGVTLLEATGVVDFISFGSESGNLEKLHQIANILAHESPEFQRLISVHLDQGLSYPAARTGALVDYIDQCKDGSSLSANEIAELTSSPNNILGLEYLKAMIRLQSALVPMTIPRLGAQYHETKIKAKISSATAIREEIKSNLFRKKALLSKKVLKTIPKSSAQILRDNFTLGQGPIFSEAFASQLLTLLRRAKVDDLIKLYDVRAGLENRIKEAAEKATTFAELIELIKTKRYTWTRIQRIVFHFLINLTSVQCEYFDQLGGPQYIRILGFTPRGQKILSLMKDRAKLPIITQIGNHFQRQQTSKPINQMLELELLATDLYSLALPNQAYRLGNRDFSEKVIIEEKFLK